jgi:hypothetical protein
MPSQATRCAARPGGLGRSWPPCAVRHLRRTYGARGDIENNSVFEGAGAGSISRVRN